VSPPPPHPNPCGDWRKAGSNQFFYGRGGRSSSDTTSLQTIRSGSERSRLEPLSQCQPHGMSSATYYAGKAKFGGLEVSDAKRLTAKNGGPFEADVRPSLHLCHRGSSQPRFSRPSEGSRKTPNVGMERQVGHGDHGRRCVPYRFRPAVRACNPPAKSGQRAASPGSILTSGPAFAAQYPLMKERWSGISCNCCESC